MELRANLLTLALVAYTASFAVGTSFSPALAQGMGRKADPGIKVFGKDAAVTQGPAQPTSAGSSGSSGSHKGQVRSYRQRKSSSQAVANLSSLKTKDVQKLAADAVRYYNEGLVDEKKGNLSGAILKFKHSLALREYCWGERDKSIPALLEKIAEVYAKQKKFSEAVVALEKALSYYTKIYGPGTSERIPTLMQMGNILQEKTDYEKSFEYFKQAYTLIERSKGKDAPEAMKLRLTLARLATKNCWDQTAAEFYKASIELDSNRLEPAELSLALEEYSAVLIRLGKQDEANEMLAKAHPEKDK